MKATKLVSPERAQLLDWSFNKTVIWACLGSLIIWAGMYGLGVLAWRLLR